MNVLLDSTPAGVRLCDLEDIADNGARNLVLQIGDARFHGFVLRRGTSVLGYVDRCPHMGLPLAHQLDGYLTPDNRLIACSWHGALFTLDEGRCVAGPCPGASLTVWPVVNRNGQIFTA
jgi:nitrite reductase/ring-hydroxylating ferredoxin subunit